MKYLLYISLLFLSLNSIAQTWSPLDSGLHGLKGSYKVLDLDTYKNKLYVTGEFFAINNSQIGALAKWDGVKWDSVGCPVGLMGEGNVLAEYNGRLHLGGGMSDICDIIKEVGNTNLLVVNWDDTLWREIGYWKGTVSNSGNIHCMAVYKGELYVGGNILNIKGITAKGIARWNGTQWRSVRSGITGGWRDVTAMAVYKDELYIGGSFTGVDSQLCLGVAKWNGNTWSPVGTGLAAGSGGGSVGGIVVDSVKNVLYLVGGFQYAGGIKVNGVAQWDGTKWDSVGSPITNGGSGICVYRNKLFIGGYSKRYTTSDTVVASWDGKKWTPHLGPDGTVRSLIEYQDKLIVGGAFNKVGADTLCRGIAAYYEPAVGINNLKENSNIEVFPNPTSNTIHVKFNDVHWRKVEMYTALGVQVYSCINNSTSKNNELVIEQNLPNGMYSIKVTADKLYYSKVIVQK
jgi:hypothetical protein